VKIAKTKDERQENINAIKMLFADEVSDVLVGKYQDGGKHFVYDIEETDKQNRERMAKAEKSGVTPTPFGHLYLNVEENMLTLMGYNKADLEQKETQQAINKQFATKNNTNEANKKRKSKKSAMPLRTGGKDDKEI
jgi:hypothetical protein